jgi:hypothetical protein
MHQRELAEKKEEEEREPFTTHDQARANVAGKMVSQEGRL